MRVGLLTFEKTMLPVMNMHAIREDIGGKLLKVSTFGTSAP